MTQYGITMRKTARRLRKRYRRMRYHLSPAPWSNAGRLERLRGFYRGQRCFVMGNGPSLNDTPLNLLEGEYVWGFNRCHLLFDRIAWRPAFYTSVDDRVVPDTAPEINRLVGDLPDTLFFFPKAFGLHGLIKPAHNVLWFEQRMMDPSRGARGYFSLDPTDFLRTPNTVTITALQLAVYMGFDPIYLIGCDTSYTVPDDVIAEGAGRDPGTGEKIEGYNLTSLRDNDPNHFDPTYFGKGAKWHAPNVNGMLYGYRCAKEICDVEGVRVFNATVGGQLEIFPRVRFETLFEAQRRFE